MQALPEKACSLLGWPWHLSCLATLHLNSVHATSKDWQEQGGGNNKLDVR